MEDEKRISLRFDADEHKRIREKAKGLRLKLDQVGRALFHQWLAGGPVPKTEQDPKVSLQFDKVMYTASKREVQYIGKLLAILRSDDGEMVDIVEQLVNHVYSVVTKKGREDEYSRLRQIAARLVDLCDARAPQRNGLSRLWVTKARVKAVASRTTDHPASPREASPQPLR